MTPEAQFVKVNALEGMAEHNRKHADALIKLAGQQEDQAFDLVHGDGEAERIKRNMEAWDE